MQEKNTINLPSLTVEDLDAITASAENVIAKQREMRELSIRSVANGEVPNPEKINRAVFGEDDNARRRFVEATDALPKAAVVLASILKALMAQQGEDEIRLSRSLVPQEAVIVDVDASTTKH